MLRPVSISPSHTVTNDIVVVQINIPSKASVKIYDLPGKLIVSQNIVQLTRTSISHSEYNAGIYIVSVEIANKIITKKIIVTK